MASFEYLDEDEEIPRPLTRANVDLAETAKDWLDGKVAEFFADYCNIFGIHQAYGVEKYWIYGDSILIRQDISCRGCYNSEDHAHLS